MQLSRTHKIHVLSLTIVVCICCCFPVAAYAPPSTKENSQEVYRQEYLQIEQDKATVIDNKDVIEDTQTGNKNVIKYYNISLSEEIQDYIFELCEQYDLSIPLVIAVMDLESEGTFDNSLICINTNGSKDVGIMQLNNRYHDYFGELIDEPDFDPENVYHNIHAGIKYLAMLRKNLGECPEDELDVWLLNSYNMGATGFSNFVKKTGTISRAYSNRVLEKREKYQNLKGDF